jgi:hypothetical protein
VLFPKRPRVLAGTPKRQSKPAKRARIVGGQLGAGVQVCVTRAAPDPCLAQREPAALTYGSISGCRLTIPGAERSTRGVRTNEEHAPRSRFPRGENRKLDTAP